VMAILVWKAREHFFSEGDEAAFFSWLQSIPGVLEVRGQGRELHIRLRSKRLSNHALRELIALYWRYGGRLSELTTFENAANTSWLRAPGAFWYRKMFG
jgi:hypothetical protein